MGSRRGREVSLPGRAESVDLSFHWTLRGDPREAAKLWKLVIDDLEEWFSQDYDDRARFSNIVDPFSAVFPRSGSPLTWPAISLITRHPQACLWQRPCRQLLLRRIGPDWYGSGLEAREVSEETVAALLWPVPKQPCGGL